MKINIVVHPNSKNPRVEEDLLGQLHLYVNEPPLEGRANRAAIELLAKHYRVPKRNVVLLSGNKSKNKVFEVVG